MIYNLINAMLNTRPTWTPAEYEAQLAAYSPGDPRGFVERLAQWAARAYIRRELKAVGKMREAGVMAAGVTKER